MRGISAIPALLGFLTLVTVLPLAPARAQNSGTEGVWSVTIPSAFPGQIFTWRVAADGTYNEDARNARSGQRMQNTVSGRWDLQGVHLVFRQDDEGYVFDGTVAGGCYIGRVTLQGRDISAFTARKRGSNAQRCDGDTTV